MLLKKLKADIWPRNRREEIQLVREHHPYEKEFVVESRPTGRERELPNTQPVDLLESTLREVDRSIPDVCEGAPVRAQAERGSGLAFSLGRLLKLLVSAGCNSSQRHHVHNPPGTGHCNAGHNNLQQPVHLRHHHHWFYRLWDWRCDRHWHRHWLWNIWHHRHRLWQALSATLRHFVVTNS